MSLRCSALPKLAACPCFESSPGPVGVAAHRGTAMDEAWRGELAGITIEPETDYELTDEDREAVSWAADQARIIAGSDPLETLEDKLKVKPPYVPAWGTMDGLICINRGRTLDLKSGLIRNYKEQMAAYSLGCMVETFSESWEACLIFCDQREVLKYRFEFDEADRIVRDVVAEYHDPQKSPRPCDYCNWCAHALNCDARLVLAEDALAIASRFFTKEGMDAILTDPEKLSVFLRGAKIVEDYQEKAKEAAKDVILKQKGNIPYFAASNVRGREYVKKAALLEFLAQEQEDGETPAFDPVDLLAICGAPTPKDLREFFEKHKVKLPEPSTLIDRAPGHSSLRESKPKKKNTKKK